MQKLNCSTPLYGVGGIVSSMLLGPYMVSHAAPKLKEKNYTRFLFALKIIGLVGGIALFCANAAALSPDTQLDAISLGTINMTILGINLLALTFAHFTLFDRLKKVISAKYVEKIEKFEFAAALILNPQFLLNALMMAGALSINAVGWVYTGASITFIYLVFLSFSLAACIKGAKDFGLKQNQAYFAQFIKVISILHALGIAPTSILRDYKIKLKDVSKLPDGHISTPPRSPDWKKHSTPRKSDASSKA